MTGSSEVALPLAGCRVISIESYGAGPYGTMFLAQLGADVIKIEPPHRDGKGGGDTARAVGPHWLRDGESLYFQTFNLNKRSLTLDLATDAGQAVLHRLVAASDAVANNLRGDIPAKLGLTYAALAKVKPAIVCAHISAYGRDNARAAWPGYDYLMQAEAGFCTMTGEPEGLPVRFGLSMVDFMSGSMMATGLLAALFGAQRTGLGRDIDVDLMSAAVHQMSYPALWYMNEGDVTPRAPRGAHPTVTPSQMFRTADGWMFVMAQLPKFWAILVDKIGRAELARDARFVTPADRRANRDVLTGVLDAVFVTASTAHWLRLLQGLVPVAPVNELAQALDNPWLETIGMKAVAAHPDRADMQVLASPIKVDGARLPSRAAPLLGADSDAVLREVGYDAAAIAALRAAGTV